MIHCEQGTVVLGKKALAKKQSLDPAVEEHGWVLLWRCKSCGRYWASSYEGRYDEREEIRCLTDAEVTRWQSRLKPS